MTLTRGTYVIMNDIDCPEAMLVAVLARYDDKTGISGSRSASNGELSSRRSASYRLAAL